MGSHGQRMLFHHPATARTTLNTPDSSTHAVPTDASFGIVQSPSLSLSLSLYLFLSLNSGPLGSNSHFMNTSWIVDILRNKKQRGEHMVKKLAVPLRHQAAHWPVDL